MKNKEIAQLLQISPATVSLALNNKPGVNEETRRKILELKESSLQSGLEEINRFQDKGTIGLLVYKDRGDIIAETSFFTAVIDVINSDARLSAYKLNIVYTPGNNIHEFIEEMNDSGLKGLIIIATEMANEVAQQLSEGLKLPFVLVDAFFPDCNVDTVLMNNRGGIYQAVKYGYEMGHRKIGFLKSRQSCNNFEDRFVAYQYALKQLGLAYNPQYVLALSADIEKGKQEMAAILAEKKDLPTLFVAGNDRIAMGSASALRDAGFRLPEDVSIIGFDDMPVVSCLSPSLTTVRLNQDRIAQLTVRRLIEKMENPGDNDFTMQQIVGVELVIRDSVADLREKK